MERLVFGRDRVRSAADSFRGLRNISEARELGSYAQRCGYKNPDSVGFYHFANAFQSLADYMLSHTWDEAV